MWDKTKRFQKDWDRYLEAGRFDMRHLKAAMVALIINDEQLPAERRDHVLSGRWASYRECHIHGDFLLVYELKDDGDTVVFLPSAPIPSCSAEGRGAHVLHAKSGHETGLSRRSRLGSPDTRKLKRLNPLGR